MANSEFPGIRYRRPYTVGSDVKNTLIGKRPPGALFFRWVEELVRPFCIRAVQKLGMPSSVRIESGGSIDTGVVRIADSIYEISLVGQNLAIDISRDLPMYISGQVARVVVHDGADFSPRSADAHTSAR